MGLREAEHIVPSGGTFCLVRSHSGLLFQGFNSVRVHRRHLRTGGFQKSICEGTKLRYSQVRGFDYVDEHISRFDAEQIPAAPASASSHPNCL